MLKGTAQETLVNDLLQVREGGREGGKEEIGHLILLLLLPLEGGREGGRVSKRPSFISPSPSSLS